MFEISLRIQEKAPLFAAYCCNQRDMVSRCSLSYNTWYLWEESFVRLHSDKYMQCRLASR